MVSATPDLRLPSQPQGITAVRPVASYIACACVQITCPRFFAESGTAASRTCDVLSLHRVRRLDHYTAVITVAETIDANSVAANRKQGTPTIVNFAGVSGGGKCLVTILGVSIPGDRYQQLIATSCVVYCVSGLICTVA